MPKTSADPISVSLKDMPQVKEYANSAEILETYNAFMVLRSDVLKALEIARNEKIIGKSMVARVTFNPTQAVKELLAKIDVNLTKVFIVAKLIITDEAVDGLATESGTIKVELQSGHTCSRCWQIVDEINEDELCPRCAEIVKNK